MKAYIDNQGKVVIKSENSTEDYALTTWLTTSTIEVNDLVRMESSYIKRSKIRVEQSETT